ncbi:hypothetical protein PL10110_240001 [Planktothrix agardhii]|nr:hypothetical protein PL10110_240001 [Planktothrix agardhii]
MLSNQWRTGRRGVNRRCGWKGLDWDAGEDSTPVMPRIRKVRWDMVALTLFIVFIWNKNQTWATAYVVSTKYCCKFP